MIRLEYIYLQTWVLVPYYVYSIYSIHYTPISSYQCYHIPLGSLVIYHTKYICSLYFWLIWTIQSFACLGVRGGVQFLFQRDVERTKTLHTSLFPGRVEHLAVRGAGRPPTWRRPHPCQPGACEAALATEHLHLQPQDFQGKISVHSMANSIFNWVLRSFLLPHCTLNDVDVTVQVVEVLSKHAGLWITRDKEIMYSQATHINFICPMRFDNFPLDTQVKSAVWSETEN